MNLKADEHMMWCCDALAQNRLNNSKGVRNLTRTNAIPALRLKMLASIATCSRSMLKSYIDRAHLDYSFDQTFVPSSNIATSRFKPQTGSSSDDHSLWALIFVNNWLVRRATTLAANVNPWSLLTRPQRTTRRLADSKERQTRWQQHIRPRTQ